MVSIDYEPLPVVVDMEEAVTDSVLIYEEIGTNIAVDFSALGMATGVTDDSFFEDCEVVMSGRVVHQRTAPAPLEPRSTAATWEGDKAIMWMSNQAPHGVKGALEPLYAELAKGGFQVIGPDLVHQ